MDVALRGSIAPFQREPGCNRGLILLQSRGKATQLAIVTAGHLLNPGCSALSLPLPEHLGKCLRELVAGGDRAISIAKLLQ